MVGPLRIYKSIFGLNCSVVSVRALTMQDSITEFKTLNYILFIVFY